MTEVSRAGSTLDIGPTLLHVLTGRPHSIGLGRSLLTPELNLVERMGDSIDQQLNDWKPSILQLWDVPDLKHGVKIKPNDQLVSLGNRSLQFPMLIDVDEDLGIKEIWFPDIDETIKQRVSNNRDVRGIWIDYCKDMDEIEENLPAQTFCLLVGSIGTKQFQIEPLLDDLDLSLDTIRERAYPKQ